MICDYVVYVMYSLDLMHSFACITYFKVESISEKHSPRHPVPPKVNFVIIDLKIISPILPFNLFTKVSLELSALKQRAGFNTFFRDFKFNFEFPYRYFCFVGLNDFLRFNRGFL